MKEYLLEDERKRHPTKYYVSCLFGALIMYLTIFYCVWNVIDRFKVLTNELVACMVQGEETNDDEHLRSYLAV